MGIEEPYLPSDLMYDQIESDQRQQQFDQEMEAEERRHQELQDDIYYESIRNDSAYD